MVYEVAMELFKKLNKPTQNLIYSIGVILLVFSVMQILDSTGSLSSLMSGLLVPVVTYSIVAVGLNLCVGYLGERTAIVYCNFKCL